jgi:serine protease DegQ
MRLGDVIVSINGKATPDVPTALNAIAEVPPGKTVPVRVIRRNQDMTLEVVVGKRRPKPKTAEE